MQLSQADTASPLASRQHGFRLSVGDALIIMGGISFAAWLRSVDFALWWLVPVVLGHFFLFCNVFLVWRRWEYLWAAIFVINVGLHFANGSVSCVSVLLWQLPITITVITLQMRSPWYHGIFARLINPQLDAYLNEER
jgi:hypothetical protein